MFTAANSAKRDSGQQERLNATLRFRHSVLFLDESSFANVKESYTSGSAGLVV